MSNLPKSYTTQDSALSVGVVRRCGLHSGACLHAKTRLTLLSLYVNDNNELRDMFKCSVICIHVSIL